MILILEPLQGARTRCSHRRQWYSDRWCMEQWQAQRDDMTLFGLFGPISLYSLYRLYKSYIRAIKELYQLVVFCRIYS